MEGHGEPGKEACSYMKKKWLCGVWVAVTLMAGLCGCGSQIPDMTDEEREAISEYAVELLLKYDSNQDSRLVDLELLEAEPEPTAMPIATEPPVQEPSGMDEVADTPVIELGGETTEATVGGNMKSALGMAETISFTYEDCQLVDSYTDTMNKELVLEAEAGKQLLVCNFVLVNDGAQKQSVDMLLDEIKYTFFVDEEIVNAQVTMLSNDLATYMGILDADEARKVVLLAEYDEGKLSGAENIYLQVQRGEEIATIQIK